MDEDERSVPDDDWDVIPVKPDRRGPKTIAMLLFLGGILILFLAYTDYQSHNLADIPDADVERLLETPNSQSDIPITNEQYQQFHDDARDSGGYLIRAIGLAISGLLVIVGSINLYRLYSSGPKIATTGAVIGFISGLYGSHLVRIASDDNLSGALLLTYEIYVYLCGTCMFLCGAFSALPLINARSRAALTDGSARVKLVKDTEFTEAE
ncbi:MAG TPA: hypothetical protein HA354_00550 [Candidatus Poseidoniaceae archaeon]|nr:hypothetical protein [Euryarchaeota archaeon]DAC60285.1 MAG TPA: hypothetical protein D7I07_00535 [Candidatus Poseidoniales archaeon]HII36969.1 hypothetical protein [Candidatus Poseidoniaceae archaeon]